MMPRLSCGSIGLDRCQQSQRHAHSKIEAGTPHVMHEVLCGCVY